jgi:hypothetical protein
MDYLSRRSENRYCTPFVHITAEGPFFLRVKGSTVLEPHPALCSKHDACSTSLPTTVWASMDGPAGAVLLFCYGPRRGCYSYAVAVSVRGPYAVAVQCLLYFSRMPSCGGIRKINWPDGWPRRTNNASGTDATSQGSFLHLSCAGRGDLARCRKRTVSSYGWHAIYGYLDVVGGMQYPPCLAVIRLTVVQCIF